MFAVMHLRHSSGASRLLLGPSTVLLVSLSVITATQFGLRHRCFRLLVAEIVALSVWLAYSAAV